jgi:glucose/arabinose dehydrogenase
VPAVTTARRRAACAIAAAALLATACSSAASSTGPSWRPKPSFQGEGNDPTNTPPAQQAQPDPQTSPAAPSGAPNSSRDPNVVAAHLHSPIGVAILPDNTALVGERGGRIVRVHPQPRRPVQVVRTLAGISTKGGGGLLDLALSPNYDEDNLIFAYISTATDNRVVAFTLKGPVTPVLKGIPRGSSDNTGRIVFRPDGTLLVGTGDAGRPVTAPRVHSLAGKVLRVTDIGRPVHSNPMKGSPLFASGLRETDGLCIDATTDTTFQVESLGSAAPADPVNVVVSGGYYGWHRGSPTTVRPVTSLPQTSRAPGGCAVANHVLYVTSLNGQTLLAAALKSVNGGLALGAFQPMLRGKYGRLRTVVAASDGALWITTSNLDGQGHPKPSDDRVLRILPQAGGGGSDKT